MKKASVKSAGGEMRAEYDFSRGVRGKFVLRQKRGNPARGRKLLAEIRHRITHAPK
jgi:hypothetical protein